MIKQILLLLLCKLSCCCTRSATIWVCPLSRSLRSIILRTQFHMFIVIHFPLHSWYIFGNFKLGPRNFVCFLALSSVHLENDWINCLILNMLNFVSDQFIRWYMWGSVFCKVIFFSPSSWLIIIVSFSLEFCFHPEKYCFFIKFILLQTESLVFYNYL